LVNLPLVLPPVVVGFYLLLLFTPSGALGRFLDHFFHIRLVFTFEGLVVGSVLFNLPFMVNPILSALEGLPRSLCDASFVLGKSPWTTFRRVLLPSIRPGLLTGIVLTFAHTMGEFGMVLMIGGKIPGVTRVASIAVYDEVEALQFGAAHLYSTALVLVSFAVLLVLILINKRFARTW
jgi:molybdate transport system permease protein